MRLRARIRGFNHYFRWKIISLLFEIFASFKGKVFYCKALKGKAYHSICINSDLSISCNCNDDLGLGKIGSLKKQSFSEIFFGKKANQFRSLLASGKLPIPNCARCLQLCLIDKANIKDFIKKNNIPRGIMIENTVNCNLNCISCDRERIHSFRTKRSMSLRDIKLISSIIKKNKIKYLSYFNLGEPFFSDRINKELKIIKSINPKVKIIISTNGFFLDSDDKKRAALLADTILFSIHGSTQKSTEKYQKGIDFHKAYNNMKKLVKYRNSLSRKKPEIMWKYLLFRWNDSKKYITNALKLAKEAKIDKIYFEKTTSPLMGLSYRHYLGFGYLYKVGSFDGKSFWINL